MLKRVVCAVMLIALGSSLEQAWVLFEGDELETAQAVVGAVAEDQRFVDAIVNAVSPPYVTFSRQRRRHLNDAKEIIESCEERIRSLGSQLVGFTQFSGPNYKTFSALLKLATTEEVTRIRKGNESEGSQPIEIHTELAPPLGSEVADRLYESLNNAVEVFMKGPAIT